MYRHNQSRVDGRVRRRVHVGGDAYIAMVALFILLHFEAVDSCRHGCFVLFTGTEDGSQGLDVFA